MSSSVLSKFTGCLISFAIALLGAVTAHAYSASQESQWEADIKEAKARAKDFKKHIERLRRADEERESASHEIKREREKDEARLEKARREYIVWRNAQPSAEKEEMRLEREHLKMLEAEVRKQEELRKSYVAGRNRVRAVLEKEAYIDEAVEYDVHSAKSVEEQNKSKPPHLLKFDVKKATGNS